MSSFSCDCMVWEEIVVDRLSERLLVSTDPDVGLEAPNLEPRICR
jgi:hypothetical protein